MAKPNLQLSPLDPDQWRLSVVLPVYSETDTVRDIVRWLAARLGERLFEVVVVVSPASPPQTRAVCDELAAADARVRVHVQRQHPGLGYAVREGYALCRGNLVLNIDSDGEMELETVPRMLEEMARGGYAMVVASRWMEGGGFEGYSRLKYPLNRLFQEIFRLAYRTRLHDLTYGYKLMRAELVHAIRWEAVRHEIGCETTLKPVRLGVPVSEVPSRWTARTQGASQNTFWRNFRYVATAARILAGGVPLRAGPPGGA